MQLSWVECALSMLEALGSILSTVLIERWCMPGVSICGVEAGRSEVKGLGVERWLSN